MKNKTNMYADQMIRLFLYTGGRECVCGYRVCVHGVCVCPYQSIAAAAATTTPATVALNTYS